MREHQYVLAVVEALDGVRESAFEYVDTAIESCGVGERVEVVDHVCGYELLRFSLFIF